MIQFRGSASKHGTTYRILIRGSVLHTLLATCESSQGEQTPLDVLLGRYAILSVRRACEITWGECVQNSNT